MTNATLAELTQALPTERVRSYIETFEDGRVQKYPQARFVNKRGECCLVAALLGARTAGDVVRSAAWSGFGGGVLEELSRRFESLRVTGQQFYEECLLRMAAEAQPERSLIRLQTR